MSTKQVRIDDRDKMRKGLRTWYNKNIHVVLTDNTVRFGCLQHSDEHTIILKNMRLKDVRIAIDDIYEIYSDVKA